MTFFDPVSFWAIPTDVLRESMREMAIDGQFGNEGVALWLGRRVDGTAQVSHVVRLRGRGVTKRPDLLTISARLMNDVTDVAIELGLILVGQIHSHGKAFGTNLSRTDRLYGVAVPDFLSVVAPDYGLKPETHITDCGCHVFNTVTRGYIRLSDVEVAKKISITADLQVPVITVGEH